MLVKGFDWDDGNIWKCQKHGMTTSEIEEVFTNTTQVMVNSKHNSPEDRMQAIGRTIDNRYAFIVFTLREKGDGLYIRAISARFMHRKEIEYYERKKEE